LGGDQPEHALNARIPPLIFSAPLFSRVPHAFVKTIVIILFFLLRSFFYVFSLLGSVDSSACPKPTGPAILFIPLQCFFSFYDSLDLSCNLFFPPFLFPYFAALTVPGRKNYLNKTKKVTFPCASSSSPSVRPSCIHCIDLSSVFYQRHTLLLFFPDQPFRKPPMMVSGPAFLSLRFFLSTPSRNQFCSSFDLSHGGLNSELLSF